MTEHTVSNTVHCADGSNQPCDVCLRDPGVSGWDDIFSRAFILRSVAAAGLAVSLLTQSVGEVVIPGTQRQSDIEARRKDKWHKHQQKKRQKSAYQSIFHICTHPDGRYLIVVFQTVSTSLSAKAQRDRWVMLLDLSVFCWWSVSVALRCVTGHWLQSCPSGGT